jgi:hypothetical protein
VRLFALFLAAAAAAPAGEIAFREHLIAADLKGGYQVVPVDMNRDGRPDLIALASAMDELVWFENPGWERRVIARGFHRMINVAAWDVNGDGVPELVLAHGFANEAKNSAGIVSVLESQGDPKGLWRVTEIDRLTTSHRLRWIDMDGSGRRVCVNAPLTGASAAAPEYRGQAPLVFYRPGEWKRQLIGEENEGVVHGLYIADWNGDGRDEVLTASFSGIHSYQFEARRGWARRELARGDPSPCPKCGASDLAVGRLGREKFLAAIEPWHGNQVAIYRGSRETIDTTLVDGHTIQTGDFDGDGNDEVIAGYRGAGRSVYLYRHNGAKWERQDVDKGGISAAACAAADLNGDGRADIACIGSATANLKWYENATPR